MSNILSTEDRRNVRLSLRASLAVIFSLLFGTLAWAGVHPPAAEARILALSAPAPAAPVPAEEASDENVGCGCSEACLIAN